MPQTITNIPRCLPQILTVPEFWYHLAHSFSRKMSLLTFRGLLKKLRAPSQSQKGHFLDKTKLKKWHQNSWHFQKSAQSSEIFVTSCGICQMFTVISFYRCDDAEAVSGSAQRDRVELVPNPGHVRHEIWETRTSFPHQMAVHNSRYY